MSINIQRLDEVTRVQIEQLANVLIDCVDGGASVSFMAPLARMQAVAFWERVASSVTEGSRVLLVAEDDVQRRIVGTVQLIIDLPPNQPHRADVAKMLVHRSARRQGVAPRLMQALEHAALDANRHVLVLDTVTGGDAERLYARLGWQRAGSIPDYALMPYGGQCATTFFYKRLAAGMPATATL